MQKLLLPCLGIFLFTSLSSGQLSRGYYRHPSIHGNSIVFTAEGDLWQVGTGGGLAKRLTTHPGEESRAEFSPDGKTLAYSANYEGPTEVYTIPANGGLPTRRTFDGSNAQVVGWTPSGDILYSTRAYSTLPDAQLVRLDSANRAWQVPLSQAAHGVYDASGKTLFFTRLPFQSSNAKRYAGGTAQQLWKYVEGSEAVPLTGEYSGTSKEAMWWKGRVYFLSDRDGSMNIWSSDETGKGLKQHTHHTTWDVRSACLSEGKVVYQLGADLHLLDIVSGKDEAMNIELASDFDHLRERWIKPSEFIQGARLSYDGKKLILMSRGKVFLAPAKQGRFIDLTAGKSARFRDATTTADGKNVIALSSETGEVELWKLPANGIGEGERLTSDGHVLRWESIPSPDGKWIAHQDKDNDLWLLDPATKQQKKVATAVASSSNSTPGFRTLRWSPDSKWLAFSTEAANDFEQCFLYSLDTGATTPLTTDRYNSGDPNWSADGKWIYFLSDRALKSTVQSPWGSRAPDPYFEKSNKIYAVALKKGTQFPFDAPDELHPDDPKPEPVKPSPTPVEIDLPGLAARIYEVPAPAANYDNLQLAGKRLCWIEPDRTEPAKSTLQCLDIDNKGEKPEVVTDGVQRFEFSGDGKKMLIRKGGEYYIFDAGVKEATLKTPKALADAKVDLKDWTFSILPGDEFRELFLDAWRLHRDYFYDRKMHGVDWSGIKEKYMTLTLRLRDRQELDDLLGQMISELSLLHAAVYGGDVRHGLDNIALASLGAQLDRDPAVGGYSVKRIYRSDPDRPDRTSPLARPGVDVEEGDVITSINGKDLGSGLSIGEMLRNKAGKQVLLQVKSKNGGEPRSVVVKPVSMAADSDLRYHSWEYSRRLAVEQAGAGQIGYVHLRAMGPNDIAQWTEEYHPVYNRQALIVDVRHNRGGNIDSWILGKLMRKAWFYWQPRVGKTTWNMHRAFRGTVVVLCDEWTASDGEAFAEGFRRLGLGKVIGMRTWGGEVWLTSSNTLSDRGVATAGELGVFADGKWLIEGHGVEPDIKVDNLPHATFGGKDAQLEAAIKFLKTQIDAKPLVVPSAPAYPVLSSRPPAKKGD